MDQEIDFKSLCDEMIREQILRRNITDQNVIAAMKKVERHHFVPEALQKHAYEDRPLHIGHGQTISQPYIVAFMTEALKITKKDKILEIGTGSGYQTAILAELADRVFSLEINEELSQSAGERLKNCGYQNIFLKNGCGYDGWIEETPFDAIMVTAAPLQLPSILVDQLKEGGRLIIPVGSDEQYLYLVTNQNGSVHQKQLCGVRFVPMVR